MKEIGTIERNGAETMKIQHQEEALCFIQFPSWSQELCSVQRNLWTVLGTSKELSKDLNIVKAKHQGS